MCLPLRSTAAPNHKLREGTLHKPPPDMSQKTRAPPQTPRGDRSRQGQLDSFLTDTTRSGREASKMAPAGRSQSAAPTSQASGSQVQVSSPILPTAPISPQSPSSLLGLSEERDPLDDMDIRRHIWALPTKADLERFADRVEKALKEDVAQLKADTNHLGNRVEALEQKLEDVLPVIAQLQEKCSAQDHQIEALLCHLDDIENRSRRANIRIRGLPEATGARDIAPTLQDIFKDILGLPATAVVEIDRAHRALKPPSQDENNPRDIICKLHKYTLKDRIMQKMRGKSHYDFDGAQLSYQDISRRTLMQRRLLRPLLVALQDAGLSYRWGFPFYLQATKDGRTVTLRTKDDLPHFLSSLDLDQVDFPDWRTLSVVPTITLPPSGPWQTAKRRNRRRGRNQRLSESSLGPAPSGD